MKVLRRCWRRLLGAIGPSEAELNAEMQSHIDLLADDFIRGGMSREEARRAARVKLGGFEASKEAYRDQRGLPQLDSLNQDIRFAFRSLARRPSFTLVAVLSLGIGIGLNATIFTWFKAVYLNPLPGVRDARELVTINAAFRESGGMSNSYTDFLTIRDRSPHFAGLFAHEVMELALSDGTSAELTMGGIVSGNYFEALGVSMARGRGFRPEEDSVPDRDAVIVLSHGLWQRRFGSDAGIIGRRVELNRLPFTVIGVAAPGFIGVYGGLRQNFWVPMHMARSLDATRRDRLNQGSWLQIMGRQKPNAGLDRIQANLDVISGHIRASHRQGSPDYRAIAYPLHRAQRGFHSGLFEIVRVLAFAVGMVLLLGCLNVASLLIARATDRSREMSVRLSLGARRIRLVRQLFTESIALALLCGIAGLGLAYATHNTPNVLSPSGYDLYFNVGIDWTVIAFLSGISFAAALVFGFLPALETSRVNLVDALKEGASSTTASRRRNLWRSSLVVGQVALSLAAIVGAVLFGQNLMKITTADKGFRAERLLTASTDLFAAGISEPRGRQFYRSIVEDLAGAPEIESVAWTTFLPMSGSGGGHRRPLDVQGYVTPDNTPLSVVTDVVSPGYLKTMGIPLVSGREFEWTDDERAKPVALVNQAFVDRFLAGRTAVGSSIRLGGTWHTIAGVHRNYIYRHPSAPPAPAVLVPMFQDYPARGAIVVARAKSDPSRIAVPLRNAIQSFDRGLSVNNLMTMETNVGNRFTERRAATVLLVLMGAVACLLTAIGLYGVLSSFVSQRRREFGIRSALGASPAHLTRGVMVRCGVLTAMGLAAGLGLAILFARVLASMLHGVDVFAVWVYAAAALLVAAVSAVSAYAPSRSVARMDPVAALKYE